MELPKEEWPCSGLNEVNFSSVSLNHKVTKEIKSEKDKIYIGFSNNFNIYVT